MDIRPCEFTDIFPIWKNHLWPNRHTEIKPISCLTIDGHKDLDLLKTAVPYFWMAKENNIPCGVISGFKTKPEQFRLRGVWVDEKLRRQGCGSALVRTALAFAKSNGCSEAWTLPRLSAWPMYQAVGFTQLTEFITDGYEFGPNCTASIQI